MRLNYRSGLLLTFGCLFAIFTAGVILVEQMTQRSFKKEALIERLTEYATIVEKASTNASASDWSAIRSLLPLLPDSIRISIIDPTGKVLFDNVVNDPTLLPNHLLRKEIIEADSHPTGVDVRRSLSTGEEYIYLALKSKKQYIRIALPYDVAAREFLRVDNIFLYWMVILFIAILFLLNSTTTYFGQSIARLRDFAINPQKNGAPDSFPNNELGEIGKQIAANYLQLNIKNREISHERERLLQHILSSREGICFFDAHQKVTFFNGLFLQYLNSLSDQVYSNPSDCLQDDLFIQEKEFIANSSLPYHTNQIDKQGKQFAVRVNRFDDGGFEIALNDITEVEKTRLLKQELTGNIAHELRTPVTGIRGYLETVLEQPLEEELRTHFIRQAYQQTLALSDLIRDMSLITKMEEAPRLFAMDRVEIGQWYRRLTEEFAQEFLKQKATLRWDIPQDLVVWGNANLLYAIFRNLTENALRYAGEGITIGAEVYRQDGNFLYFSFYDTGTGIQDEKHFSRLFERFYRISEGRTRDSGGTGLGLSIVKNAVLLHKGEITVKNRSGGGLEFLFRLPEHTTDTSPSSPFVIKE